MCGDQRGSRRFVFNELSHFLFADSWRSCGIAPTFMFLLIPQDPTRRRDSAGKPLTVDGSANERFSFILFLPHFYGVRVTRKKRVVGAMEGAPESE